MSDSTTEPYREPGACGTCGGTLEHACPGPTRPSALRRFVASLRRAGLWVVGGAVALFCIAGFVGLMLAGSGVLPALKGPPVAGSAAGERSCANWDDAGHLASVPCDPLQYGIREPVPEAFDVREPRDGEHVVWVDGKPHWAVTAPSAAGTWFQSYGYREALGRCVNGVWARAPRTGLGSDGEPCAEGNGGFVLGDSVWPKNLVEKR